MALVAYVALCLLTLLIRDNVLLLNWIIGPLFLVTVLYGLPRLIRVLAGGLRSR